MYEQNIDELYSLYGSNVLWQKVVTLVDLWLLASLLIAEIGYYVVYNTN